jgi:hypothetical protein
VITSLLAPASRPAAPVIRRAPSAAGPAPAVAPPIVHDVLRSSGAPLDAPLRGEMESRFGHSFADVRVHADSRAAESARAVGAHAYAVGRDVVFGAGRYAPESIDGKRLIAHELAHVVQQRGASASLQPKLEIGAADDPAEREADAAAEAVTGGSRAALASAAAGPAVVRCQRVPRTQPTGAEVREDERLRRMGRWPAEAHARWRRLSDAQRTLVLFHMAGNYGPAFARAFHDLARTRRGRFRPLVNVTNMQTPPPAELRRRGWALASVSGGIQYWVRPSGDEMQILPSRNPAPVEEAPPEPASQAPPPPPPEPAAPEEDEGGPPSRVPPRTSFGRVVQRATAGASGIMPGATSAVRYEDGTVEVQARDGVTTYRPRAGSEGAFDIYGTDGALIPDVVWSFEVEEVFGAPATP